MCKVMPMRWRVEASIHVFSNQHWDGGRGYTSCGECGGEAREGLTPVAAGVVGVGGGLFVGSVAVCRPARSVFLVVGMRRAATASYTRALEQTQDKTGAEM